MLESADLEAEFLRHAEQHQNFVFAIAMRMDVALAFEYFDKWIEPKITAGRDRFLIAGGNALVVVVPRFLVVSSLGESGTYRFFDAHAGSGIARRRSWNAEVGTLGILTKRKLDAGKRAFEGKLRGGLAPTEFDDDGLPADGVCGAVQNICDGNTSGEIAIDVDVIR